MGFFVLWVGVRGRSRADVLDYVDLETTGVREALPESCQTVVGLPQGWTVLHGNEGAGAIWSEKAQALSERGDAVVCGVIEGTNFSMAVGYVDGHERWSVTHDVEKGARHLEVEGEPPPGLDAILAKANEAQAEADRCGDSVDCLFDVPVDVAQAVVGFRHDEDFSHLGETPFEVVARPKPVAPVPGRSLRGNVAQAELEQLQRRGSNTVLMWIVYGTLLLVATLWALQSCG